VKKMAIVKLKTPVSVDEVRKLHVGDTLYVTGTMVLARDEGHMRLLELHEKGEKSPIPLEGMVLYHCGPVVKKNEKWKVIAAGPTTSTRMELFEDRVIENYGIRVIIGKGGMGEKTTEAMKKHGAVYGAFVGGAAVLAAEAIKEVVGVEWLDLGTPEAFWILDVKEFGPLMVAIDSHGNNIFLDVKKQILENKEKIYKKLGL
jgi:fumarate hydratase subunit beta